MLLLIVLAELRRRAATLLLEDAVEVRDVVEAASVADFHDGHRAVYQQPGSIAQPDIDDVFGDILARAQLEETAEGGGCHRYNVSQVLQMNFLTEMSVDILLHLLHPAAVGGDVGMRERTGQHGTGVLQPHQVHGTALRALALR